MGQKVNPNGLRIGISRPWTSSWYVSKDEIGKTLKQDMDIRNYLNKRLAPGVVSHIDIERTKDKVLVKAYVQYVGKLVASEDEKFLDNTQRELSEVVNGHFTKKQLQNMKKGALINVRLNLFPVKQMDLDATLVAKDIARQLEGRSTARVVQKKAIAKVMKAGAKGIKTRVKGRVGGAEIARAEKYNEGVLSLHTLTSDIDYALAESHTTYGILGCKVWISRPDNYKDMQNQQTRRPNDRRDSRDGKRRFDPSKRQNQQNRQPRSEQPVKKGE